MEESDFVDANDVYDDPLAALAGAAQEFAVEDDEPVRPRDRAEKKPRRVVHKSHRDAGPFMFFGAVLFIAGIVGAAATGLRAEPDDQMLYFILSGAGGLTGMVLFFVGLSRA